jgi:hypothetical protein
MYSQAEAHLANLDHVGGRGLRRAYLALLIGIERAGFHTIARETVGEVAVRDAAGRQPFVLAIGRDRLGFHLRRPAFEADAALAGRTASAFAGRLEGDPVVGQEVRIRVASEADAEDVVEWLQHFGDVSPGYAGRRSA